MAPMIWEGLGCSRNSRLTMGVKSTYKPVMKPLFAVVVKRSPSVCNQNTTVRQSPRTTPSLTPWRVKGIRNALARSPRQSAPNANLRVSKAPTLRVALRVNFMAAKLPPHTRARLDMAMTATKCLPGRGEAADTRR